MTDGIAALRGKKASRATRQAPPPRHPMTAGVVAQFDNRGGEGVEPAAQVATVAPPAPSPPPPLQEAKPPQPAAKAAPVNPTGQPVAAPGVNSSRTEPAPAVALPDLNIDWSDPLMHVASPTRVSVANSVAARFKAVADQPGVPPQTELIMEAVSRHLAQLPELVLKRRPEESGADPAGFFVRRAPVQKAEPWQPVYMRPMAGEVEALRRIVEWVNGVILDGHPGRQKSSRSEVVTAALDAAYPAA